MAKNTMKDIEANVDNAIDNDGGPNRGGGSTPDTVLDHDDMRGDGTYGTTATPSTVASGIQHPAIRAAVQHIASGGASPDDIDVLKSVLDPKTGIADPEVYDDAEASSSGPGNRPEMSIPPGRAQYRRSGQQ